jgi:superfamily II DNA or RNA helicase
MQARDYQQRCVDAIMDATAKGLKSILCVLFTGAGKTVVFALLARLCSHSRVLIIAPMRELVWQAADTADRVTGEYTEVEMGRSWATESFGRVIVACRNTLLAGREKRYKRLLGVRVVIVDEAHTQFSEPFLAMLREFQEHGAIIIGFTATPFRMDGRRLMDFYQTVAFDYGLPEGIRDGWCVPWRARIVQCSSLDLSSVRVSGGDYSAADLDLVMGASRQLHKCCLTIQRERVGSAIAFLPGVDSARALAEMAERQYGINAAWVCGDTYRQSEDDRNLIINRYRKGEIDLLCNCQIATMGFDAPLTRTIFQFRPTRSRVLALQIWGRATRPLPGVVDGDLSLSTPAARVQAIAASDKPWFKVVDLCDTLENHSIVTCVDMFAQDMPEDVRREGREQAANEEAEAQDPADLLAQAAEKLRKAKLIEAGLGAMTGVAGGRVHGEDVSLDGKKKSIADYRVPLRGRHAGKTMKELDDGFIDWALRNPRIRGWQRTYFKREQARRRSAVHNG